MNINFPGGNPVLTLHGRPLIVQHAAQGLAPYIVAGSVVKRGRALSDGTGGATTVTISLAERLHASPSEVESLLSRPVGSRFQTGDEIARARKGLRGQTVHAPFNGILQSYNPLTGVAIFMSIPFAGTTALVSGDIDAVATETVAIRTSGSRAFGIIGFGQAGSGPIQLISPDPSHVVDPSEITASLHGAVVAAGPWVSAAGYRRFVEVGVAAVISGGIIDSEIAAAFSLPADSRIGAWRRFGAEIASPIAVIATEGFGRLPMHPALWSFFRDRQGLEAIVTTETAIGERLVRPQIIVEEVARSATPGSDIQCGSKLRLVDQAEIGLPVEATAPPTAQRSEIGRAVETIDVVLPNQKIETVPIANIEFVS
jgi:hypothetical protein